jgi:hypothetical protein
LVSFFGFSIRAQLKVRRSRRNGLARSQFNVVHESKPYDLEVEAEHETPEGFEILYPPPSLDADALRRLAEATSRLEQLDDLIRRTMIFGRKDFLAVRTSKFGRDWWLSPLKLALMVLAADFRRPPP